MYCGKVFERQKRERENKDGLKPKKKRRRKKNRMQGGTKK
jgi:hypothetical protein